MRQTFKVPYSFTYGGSLGRKTKHIIVIGTKSNENIVIESAEGDPEATEIFRSEVMGSFSKRTAMEKYLKKAIDQISE